MMKRKKWLHILAGAACCCCLCGAMACGDKEVKPVDLTSMELTTEKPAEDESMFVANPKTNILVNSCIDVEDYIVVHKDGLARAVQMQFTDRSGAVQTVAVKGVTYYPTVSGKYTMIYTEQFADKILRDSMEITVYSPEPKIEVSSIPLYYTKGAKVKLRLLLNNANPFCGTSSTFKIESVTYRQYEVALEETVKAGTETTTDLTGANEYTFAEYGSYSFLFSTEVDGVKGYSSFRVEVLDENGAYNEDTLQNTDGTYASGNAQVDGNTVRLIQAEYAAASYLVLEDDYYDQDVLRVEFKGKNVPNIGLLTQENLAANNPYNIVSGRGYTLSFENTYTDMFSIWGYGVNYGKSEGRFDGMNLHNGNDWTGYWGRNHFDSSKYYMIETKLDSGSVDEALSVFYLNIYEIENYGTPTQSYKNVYDAMVPAGETMEGKLEKGKIVFYSSAKEDVTFKYYKPTGRVKNFEVSDNTVTWDAKEGAVGYMVSPNGLNYTFQTANSFTFNNYIENLTPLYVKPVVDNGFTNLTDGSSALVWTEVNPDGNEQTKYNLMDGPAVFNKYVPAATEAYTGEDFIVSADGELAKEVGVSKPHAMVSLPFVSIEKQSYVTTKDSYGSGTYVAMEFIGSKLPSFILFGVGEHSDAMHDAVGVGVDLDWSTFGPAGYYKADGETSKTIPVEKYDGSKLTRGYFKSTGYDAAFAGEEDFPFAAITKYLLVIGAKQNGANVDINYYIFAQTSETAWEQYEVNTMQIPNVTLNEGKISVRSTAVVAGLVSQFKMYKPDTFDNLNETLHEVYGVTCFDASSVFTMSAATGASVGLNADGTYQLNAAILPSNNTAYNYVATKAQYGSGTYLMAEFKGKELPGMVLFGVNNVTDPLSFTNTQESYVKQATWNGVGLYTDLMWGQVLSYHKAAGGDATYTLQTGKFNRHGDEVYGVGTESTFVLIVGAENSGANVVINYTLYKKSGTALTLFNAQSYTIANASVSAGSIVFTSSHQVPNSVANIKLWTIGTKTEVETKLAATYTINS